MLFVVFASIAVLKGLFSVFMKISQRDVIKSINDSMFFLVVTSFFQMALLFVLPPYYPYSFSPDTMIYPLVFSVFYFLTFSLVLSAFRQGPTSLTTVLQNFNMFVPIAAGIILWNETVNPYQLAGIVLFIISLFIFNSGRYMVDNIQNCITLKWLLISLTATLFSGFSIFTSKQYALICSDSPKEFLIIYNFAIVVFGSIYFTYLNAAGRYKPVISGRLVGYAALTAVTADIMNILYMLYVGRFASAFFFPLLSTSAILSVVIMSRIFLKESLPGKAYAGLSLCLIALFLLGISV